MPPRTHAIVTDYGDRILAGALVGLMVVQVASLDISRANAALAAAAALALLVPLAHRVRMPLTLLIVLLGVGATGQWLPKQILDVEAFGLIVILVIYNGAAHTSGRRAWAAGAMTAFLELTVLLSDPDGTTFSGMIFFTLLFGAPWLAGYVVRRRRQSEALLRRERDAAEAAIVDERARIARELHDVVAHAISVIVLQARGGRRLLDTEPEETRGALDTIEHTGQQALVEMRRLVGLLREADKDLSSRPNRRFQSSTTSSSRSPQQGCPST